MIAFNDVHNFHLSADVYKKFFREEYLKAQIPSEPFDLNNVHFGKTALKTYFEKGALNYMSRQNLLKVRDNIDTWGERNFPETCAENVHLLDSYLMLCEQNKIRPIMFLPPMSAIYIKYFSKKKLDEFRYLVGQACRKHPSAVFIDGWKLQGLTDADFRDIDHMNIYGAAKFSMFLNSVIEQLDRT